MRRALLLAIATILFCSATAYADTPLDRIVAFGDSYSDNGAGYAATRAMVAHDVTDARAKPGPDYWRQRWSNGPTAVEVMADTLSLPLADYAIGGATSGTQNYYSWMNRARPTGTLAQIDDYLAHQPRRRANDSALYVIFASANDFFAREDFKRAISISKLAEKAANNIERGVTTLSRAGARHILVIGSVDLEHVPAVVQQDQTDDARQFASRFDRAVKAALAEPRANDTADITWFDHQAVTARIRDEADQYDLTNLHTPCRPVMVEAPTTCQAPDTYFYWDEWHPTRVVHRLLGLALARHVRGSS
ncbi:SGNH/GDSL hydrolase family protein [uncultured Salinisphaera sp.]|uniref:SGNH/GDSL hydrolase family protein n=1 Tax=uncultured Salinisphaera sp. TaxID=359372 RepID=UPI0032B0F1FC|tara:strand:- start:1277 stop:2194 length:918 start_codon:yes stop_codon:yes gene_type:complete